MTPIENTRSLRSAFLKIGWAPLVCIIGAVLIVLFATLSIIRNYPVADNLLVSMKWVFILASAVSLAGYLLSYIGFAQAHRQFGLSKAGEAFSSLKTIFLIYCIIGIIMLILTLVIPTSVESYANINRNLSADARMASMGGIVIFLAYIILEVFSIVAMFIIRNSAVKLARTTNIAALSSVATGAKAGVYCFFLGLATAIISLVADSKAIYGILSLALLALAIFAIVKWIGGWLGAASEVIRHPVEAEDYNDTTQQ